MPRRLLALALLVMQGGLLASSAPAPYGVADLPNPTGRTLEELLPRAIGPFERLSLDTTEVPANSEVNVEYSYGSRRVTVGVSAAASVDMARCAVGAARHMLSSKTASKTSNAIQWSDGPLSFVKSADFIAWNRERIFFYVRGNSADALDLFMRSFGR